MARVRDFAAEYARRVAKGRERGLSRQQARGHRPAEHVERAEREREEHGISSSERASIARFAERIGARNKDAPDEDELADFAIANGYAAFVAYREMQTELHRNYKRQTRSGAYASLGRGYIEGLASGLGLPDTSWLYYH